MSSTIQVSGVPPAQSLPQIVSTWLSIHDFKPVSKAQEKATISMVCRQVKRLIDRYGEDGYGDKPKHMDTYSYWLQHIQYEDIDKLQ